MKKSSEPTSTCKEESGWSWRVTLPAPYGRARIRLRAFAEEGRGGVVGRMEGGEYVHVDMRRWCGEGKGREGREG